MSDKMSGVYSGGLLYEYSVEENDFGIVTLDGDDVETSKEYDLFKSALKEYPAPTGNGGAASTTHSVSCPTSESIWQVDPSLVPEMPEQAQKYMKSGAGDGPGLDGDGSQDASDSGTSTASATAGQSSPTSGSKDEDNAAPMNGPAGSSLLITGAAVLFTLFGTLLL